MSDKLYTYPIDKLLKWILTEEKNGKIFGYYKDLFFTPSKENSLKIKRYNQLLENPLGVAAGPHTQLSQNIILSWLFGARYIELKTVQVLDELDVTKPCIDMEDEGYNCEWSQELKIEESYDEYLNAWIIIHLLKDLFGWNETQPGFIFNISVGYDLKGIKSERVTGFLKKMKDSSKEINEKINEISKTYLPIIDVNIPSQISDNITLSTMHGCPPDEIENIVEYLIGELGFHTAVKLNPTLLGKVKLKKILNEKLGYPITVPDEAFEHDLKFEDAVPMIERLLSFADKHNREFGLKLTNTLETKNSTRLLPSKEDMVYMSGRALHPISVNTAALLQNEFDGKLDISFSGGVDAFNFTDVIASNLMPATTCTDLLKPGGYSRLPQYLENLKIKMKEKKSSSIEEFNFQSSLENLNAYAEKVLNDKRYHYKTFKYENIKTKRKLTEFDCIKAPCVEACAIEQDVPAYMYYSSKENFENAYKVILDGNPLPNITGMVCDHLCSTKCTRMNIDNSLLIREIKRFVSEIESSGLPKKINKINKKAAIIGAGPSGLSAAYFLIQNGFDVDLFETKSFAGGMASGAIPIFRIKEESIKRDIDFISNLGVNFHYNQNINKNEFEKLKNEFDFIYIAIGAQKEKQLNIPGEEFENVYDQITFLSDTLKGESFNLGKSIAIIGGGNSAMDAARTAKRLAGNDGKVTVVYRRTINEMPADKEEIEALIEEGIEIKELTSPFEIDKNKNELILKCCKNKLSEKDDSGRRKPVKIEESEFELRFDSIITAIGQDIVLDFFPDEKIVVNPKTNETQLNNVFAGGDAVRGADTLINAIADGKKVANIIASRENINQENDHKNNFKIDLKEHQQKIGKREYGKELPIIPVEERDNFNLVHPSLDEKSAVDEAGRCLFCDEICNVCVSVCPNLSNQYYVVEQVSIEYPVLKYFGKYFQEIEKNKFEVNQRYQIINIADFCNECGNCDTFCPTSGSPYKSKPKFHLSKKSFEEDKDGYFIEDNFIYYKEDNEIVELEVKENLLRYNTIDYLIEINKNDFSIINFKTNFNSEGIIDLRKTVEMYYLFDNIIRLSFY